VATRDGQWELGLAAAVKRIRGGQHHLQPTRLALDEVQHGVRLGLPQEDGEPFIPHACHVLVQ
jgi:hypothetical protein